MSATTRIYGLLGYPVGHSLSPRLHNSAFQELALEACYLAFPVPPEVFEPALAGAHALGVQGLNITVPHKERALALCAEADPVARQAGAANTLCRQERGWKAFNTDVKGLLRALAEDLRFGPRGRRCLIFGAGGAARAAAVGLFRDGAQEILVSNRNGNRAEKLAADLAATLGTDRIRAVDLGEVPGRMVAGDLLVSATPLGLSEEGRWPWELSRFPAGIVAYDMAYRKGRETPLVEAAREAGWDAASGRSMLLHQGALAFELWTGRPAPLAVMAEALEADAAPPALEDTRK